jgi:putative ABC transport system ATP-binding protein
MKNFKINYKKLYKPFSNDLEGASIFSFVKKILKDEKDFLYVIAIYSFIISLLSVAVPISVQLLINSVSFTALLQPIITLGFILFVLLIFSASLNALQFYTAEIFQRHFMANMAAKICLQIINADMKKLEESNSTELLNRFFDVVTIQKTVPSFLTKTLAFILQAIIGLILVSFYHPFFLAFSIFIAFCLYLIYRLYFKKACISAFYKSRRKYDIVGWLEDIAQNVASFKSENGQKYAKFKVNELTDRYLTDRKTHFSFLFTQTILLLLLYAISSTLLLVLGGYLVLKGQLTIGQLVAAELILSAILYGISRFGGDFENIYDLIAACEKLSIFFNIPAKKMQKNAIKIEDFNKITFENAASHEDQAIIINLSLENGKKYLIHDKFQQTQKFLIDSLLDFARPMVGEVKIDGIDFYSYDMMHFKNRISVINSMPLLEGSLIENLTFNDQNISEGRVNQVLKDLDLDIIINNFENKLNLRIIPSGWPLNEQQVILLKVARAIVCDAQIIIANEVLDMLDYDLRQKVLEYIAKNCDGILIYFSNHKDDNHDLFDKILEI